MCRTACLLFIFSDLRDLTLTLTFLNQTYVLMQYPPETYSNTLGEFELFAAHLTDPRGQNMKKLHLDIWTDLDLTLDLNIKM